MVRQAKTFEVTIGTIDVAGLVKMQELGGGVGVDIDIPGFAKQIADIIVGGGCSFGALGSGGAGFIIDGDVERRQELPAFAGGGENVTDGGTHLPGKFLPNVGIKCVGGGVLTIKALMWGEDIGDVTPVITVIFDSAEPTKKMQWKALEVQLTTLNAEVAMQAIGEGVAAKMKVATGATLLDRIIGAGGSDGATLGSGSINVIGSNNGLIKVQQLHIASGGSELITGMGTLSRVVDYPNLGFDVDSKDSIDWKAQMNGEDMGTTSVWLSAGFLYTGT